MISSGFAAYYLILILLSTAALIKAFLLWRRRKFPQGYRMVFGLSLLTLLRVALLLAAVFSWQGSDGFSAGFSLLNISLDLLCFLIIIWMWSFPEPSQIADLASGVLAGLTFLFSLGQILAFPSLLDSFTASPVLWQAFILFTLLAGTALILIRQPNQWENGLLMLGILTGGVILNWVFPKSTREIIDVFQLTQLAAYPLLILLVNRFYIYDTGEGEDPRPMEVDQRHRTSVDLRLMKIIQAVFGEQESTDLLYRITQCAAELMIADLCFMIDTPDKNGKVQMIAGYDLIREDSLQSLTLDARSIPLLTNYMENGKMLHLPASSTSRDLSHLAHVLQLTSPGHLLAAPIPVPSGNRKVGLVLFSPFSKRPWVKSDQEYAEILIDLFSAAFRHHFALEHEDPDQVKQTIRELSSQLTKLTQKKKSLQEELSEMAREVERLRWENQSHSEKIAVMKEDRGSLLTHLKMLSNLAERESLEAYKKYLSMVEKELEIKREKTGDAGAEPGKALTEAEFDQQDLHEPARLLEIFTLVKEELEPRRVQKEIGWDAAFPEDMPALQMTAGLFQEILTILLTNAFDETKPGSEINLQTQIYQEDPSQQFAHVKIGDQGGGYYPHELAAVLNNPLTDDDQVKLSPQMTNLYVSKNLVENEGGRMWVESEPGEGTVVSLLLPLQKENST